MITQTLIAIAQMLRPAAGILLFLTWWPHRKSGMLSSVPWILLYLAFFDPARRWNVWMSGRMMYARGAGESITPGIYDYLVFVSFLSQARYLLIAVMVVINVAFVLQHVHPVNRFELFLARQQRFQYLLGVLLIFLLIAPILVGWVATLWLSRGAPASQDVF